MLNNYSPEIFFPIVCNTKGEKWVNKKCLFYNISLTVIIQVRQGSETPVMYNNWIIEITSIKEKQNIFYVFLVNFQWRNTVRSRKTANIVLRIAIFFKTHKYFPCQVSINQREIVLLRIVLIVTPKHISVWQKSSR